MCKLLNYQFLSFLRFQTNSCTAEFVCSVSAEKVKQEDCGISPSTEGAVPVCYLMK